MYKLALHVACFINLTKSDEKANELNPLVDLHKDHGTVTGSPLAVR